MATIDTRDANGAIVPIEKPLPPGSTSDALSRPIAFSTEGKAQLAAIVAAIIAGQYTEDDTAATNPVAGGISLVAIDTPANEVATAGKVVGLRGTRKGEAYTKNPDLEALVGSDETAATNATSAAYEASKILKASAGRLYSLTGYNSKATAQFIQVHNSAGVPSEGAIPAVLLRAEGLSNFSIDYGSRGRSFSNGITVCNSSTGPAKTIGSTDCWFDGQTGAA